MRLHTDHRRPRGPRALSAGIPVAVAGSIALVLASTPAQAAERISDERMLRPAPADASVRAALAQAPRAASVTPTTHTVQRGETVTAIAVRYGLRTVDVLALNGLSWSTMIHPGQVLRLTGAAAASPSKPATPSPSASTSHTVVAGDTISAIAKRYGTTTQKMLAANGLGWSSIIYPGQKLRVPGKSTPPAAAAPVTPAAPAAPSAGATYVVVAGDTISAIAQRHGVSVQAVLSANGLSSSSIIYPGQKLAVPGKARPAAASTAGLDAEQIENARLIIKIGRELGVSDRGIAVALGTAMQESWIRNLDWGDRDSLGLFQQRPSTGWGTADQVRDRVRSIKAFYGGAGDPNGTRTRGLLDIPGWERMTYAQAAQAVQISAYPDRYARWEKPAYAWLAALG